MEFAERQSEKRSMDKIAYQAEWNQSIPKIRSVYDYYNSFDFLIGKELTFTVAPGRCVDIQAIKKKILSMVAGRMKHAAPIAFILTRENHENGWPHIHGIGWWCKDRDNSLTLSGGRLYLEEKEPGKKFVTRGYKYNELGRVQVDELRNYKYTQYTCSCKDKFCKHEKEGQDWDDWLAYICKDQNVKWRDANVIVRQPDLDISKFFSKSKVDNFVD